MAHCPSNRRLKGAHKPVKEKEKSHIEPFRNLNNFNSWHNDIREIAIPNLLVFVHHPHRVGQEGEGVQIER